jgi:hypothetical protein
MNDLNINWKDVIKKEARDPILSKMFVIPRHRLCKYYDQQNVLLKTIFLLKAYSIMPVQ